MMHLVSTDIAARELLKKLVTLPVHTAVIALDTETTGLFPHEHDVLRGVSLAFFTGTEVDSFYIPLGYPIPEYNLDVYEWSKIVQALKYLDPFYVLHHGKFDFSFLPEIPMPAADRWVDTKVLCWLEDENLPTGLKENAARRWGEEQRDEQTEIKKLVKEHGWEGLTPYMIWRYACKDAELTLRLYSETIFLASGMAPVLGDVRPAIEREMEIQGVLMRMERNGILVDQEKLERLTFAVECRLEQIETDFNFNLSSPTQVAKWLHEAGALPKDHPMTPSGKPSMSRAALEALENVENPLPGLARILEHRRLQKSLSSYLRPLKARMGRDGRIHPGFSSTGTVTGRFSCSNPNLQTIPRRDTLEGVRDLFVAEEGYELWSYDLQAAEMRVVAGMSGEQVLIDGLNKGWDMHGILAEKVFGPNYTGIQRRYAKNIGYGFFYGLTSTKTAAKYIKGDDGEKIAGEILAGLRQMYPNVVRLMNESTRQAERDKYIRIHDTAWEGRYRRFATPAPLKPKAYTALNAKVQGGIGEVMKDVMLLSEFTIDAMGARLCLQVHDELVIEVPAGRGEEVRQVLQNALDDVNPFAMPMIFDGHEWSFHE